MEYILHYIREFFVWWVFYMRKFFIYGNFLYIGEFFIFMGFFSYGNFLVFFYIGEFFLFLRAWRPAPCYWGIFSFRERGGEAPELFSFIFRGCKIYGHSISIHEIFLSFFQNARAIYAATKHIKSMPSISFLSSIIS